MKVKSKLFVAEINRPIELRSRIKRELNNKGKGLRGKEIWEMIKSMIPKTDSSMADDKKRDKSVKP